MGIWVELGIFAVALLFGLWQIYDVRLARRKTEARKKALELPTSESQVTKASERSE